MATPVNANELIALAKVGRPYGLQGAVHVFPFSRDSETLLRVKSVFLRSKTTTQLYAVTTRPHGDAFVMQIEGITDPEGAAAFTNNELLVDRSVFPPLAEGEYYWIDMIGLSCTDGDKLWGVVTEIFESGAHPILRVYNESTQHEELIPFVMDAIVRSIDMTARRIDVAWLGLD